MLLVRHSGDVWLTPIIKKCNLGIPAKSVPVLKCTSFTKKCSLRGGRKSSQKLAKRRTLVSFPTPSLPPETNENRNPGFNVPLLELETFSRRERTSSQPFSMSSVTWAIHDRSLVGSSSNEGITALSQCVRVCFTSKSEVENFTALSWTAGRSARRRWPVAPRQDRVSTCMQAASLNESRSVSDRSAPLVAAGTLAALNGEPDVAWSERTRRTAVLVASPRLGRLSLAAWYRWCGGQGEPVISKFSILRRTVTSVFRTSEKLLHCLFVFVASRVLSSFPRHLMDLSATPFAMQARASRSNSNRCAARRIFFLFFFFFFFLKLALRLRSRPPPPPQTNILRFASFCELLRRPLTKGKMRTPLRLF